MTSHEPNDELNHQHDELASAYLDGVASPAERAEVEGSSELQALVASFTEMRAQLADVPSVAVAVRRAALATALAEFDAPAVVAAVAPASAAVIPMSSKRRWARPVLSVAAAILLVGAIGVAANRGLSDNDSPSSSDTIDSSAKVAAADASTEAQMTADTMSVGAASSTIGAISGGAQAPLIIDAPGQLLELTTEMADTILPAAVLPETTAAASETTAAANTAYARPALSCLTTQQVFLADIQYQGVFAIAARDTVTGVTSAITDDCIVLTTVGP